MSWERLHTLYLVGWVMSLIGFFSCAGGGEVALAFSSTLMRDVGIFILLLGFGFMVVGGICSAIAWWGGYQQLVQQTGRKWLGSWDVNMYLLDRIEPRRRKRH